MPVDLLPDLDYHALGHELNIPGLDGTGSEQTSIDSGGGEATGEDIDLQEELLDMFQERKKNKSGIDIKEIVQEYNENPVNLVSEHDSSCLLKVAAHLISNGEIKEGRSVQDLWIESAIGSEIPVDIQKQAWPIEMTVQGNLLQCFKVSGINVITCNRKVAHAAVEPMTLSIVSQLFHNIVCGADREQRG